MLIEVKDALFENDSFNAYTENKYRFSAEEAELLMTGCKPFNVKKNSTIYNTGSTVECVHYLRRGTVKYHMIYPDGSSRTTAFSEAPSFLGVINMIPGGKTVNCCSAVTNCEISVCPVDLFMERLRENDMMEKMISFAIGASQHVYSNLMVVLSEDRLKLVDLLRNHQQFTLQETADFIGCSRVHVSRLCKQLKETYGTSDQNQKKRSDRGSSD